MTTEEAKELGQFIARTRKAKGLSLRAVADAVGADASSILRMERGEFKSPAPAKLQRLARVLDVAVEDLYALAGYTTPEGLPELGPYVRAKYGLSKVATKELESYFEQLRLREQKGGRRAKRST